MADVNNDIIRYKDLLLRLGGATLNALFPKDFEYYMLYLELVGLKNGVEKSELFVFPIMPTRISESEVYNENIKKTFGGVSVNGTNSFIPFDIQLQGDFGRKLKLLIGNELIDFSALSFNVSSFATEVKTGYGCFKILEHICRKSKTLDENNQSHRLYLYNPAIGNNYQVRVVNLTKQQTLDKNMIWGYNLTLKAIERLDIKEPTLGVKNLIIAVQSIVSVGATRLKDALVSKINVRIR